MNAGNRVRPEFDYRRAMASSEASAPQGYPPIFGWPRVRVALAPVLLFGLLMGPGWKGSPAILLLRLAFEAFCFLLAFGVLERWPRRLPPWIARWGLQVLGVAITAPFAMFAIYCLTTIGDHPSWLHQSERLQGFGFLTFLGVLIAPWMAIAALLRQIRGEAERQALAFGLERSELERQATDARMHLLQAQVAPHFLFNTLANVQALVDAGSPQASTVLRSLVAYLRAAVPRINEQSTTLGQELQLVQAYLELMHMRMPDRLTFALHVDDAARSLRCPPMTLLTLVENAVRHGIDPGEDGGRIDISVQRRGERCLVRVSDTGVGLRQAGNGLGTGLASLRERLQLVFGGDAQLRLGAQHPQGVCAEVEFPVRETSDP
ncbi:MAG TPA: histidine kinase [Xanthomonadaceae bacterium]